MIDGKTKLVALIGNPVSHSLSPLIHNSAFNSLNINAVYLAFKVGREKLSTAVEFLKDVDAIGANVTVPYKEEVVKYVDLLTDEAKEIGAINTVLFTDRVEGHNTDGKGAIKALEEAGVKADSSFFIFGAGGAARAIATTLAMEGAEIFLSNRTEKRGKELVKKLCKYGKAKFVPLNSEYLYRYLPEVETIINATTVGMDGKCLVPENAISEKHVVMDIVYSPLKTELIKRAEKVGAKTITGDRMLLYQAALSFEIWFKRKAPVEIMETALKGVVH